MEYSSGQRVGRGRFEVLARLGEGGGGIVYEVRDRDSDARLALKTVRSAQPDAVASLKHEFRAVQDITHPNLVRLDELFEEDGAWFFTMELVLGLDWLTYVRVDGELAFDESRLRATLAQVVEALTVLHQTGTMHRDVKPSNVLVSSRGHVKLLDFGIAAGKRRIDPAVEGVVGTLAYMPPEQLLSEEPTPAGDFYAMGVMLHQALTGKLPYFDRAGDSIAQKLGGAPTPVRDVAPKVPEDLATLCDALLRQQPAERPDAGAILRELGARDATSSRELVAREDLVGRTSELAALHDAFASVAAGGAAAVIVEGASGVGKSALVEQFLHGLGGRALVFHGRCHEREFVPYKGIDAIVDELAAHLTDGSNDALLSGLKSAATPLLPRLFPVLERVPFFADLAGRSPALAEGDVSELRGRIFGAFRELVTGVAERLPLVISIDDVQWADGDSLALLADLLAPPSPPPLLLVCTRRLAVEEGDSTSAPPAVPLPGDVRTLRLGGLSDDESAALASRLARDKQLDLTELAALTQESGGHPLFLQELMRRRRLGTEATPDMRLDDALWSRVALLGEEERRIVEAVAVAGFPTSLDVIATAASIPRRELAQHMAALRGASLVNIAGSQGARRIGPYHDRVREAVVLHLDEDALRAWHERLAMALEASPDRDVERLAVHWEGAGDGPRAAVLFREAGEHAGLALAFDRAALFYRKSLALGGTTAADRAALEYALADSLFNAGRGGEAGHVFLRLAGPGLDRKAVDLRVRAASAFFGSGHFAEGIDAIRAAIAAADLPFPEGRFSTVFKILWYRRILRLRGLGFVARDPATIPARDVMRFDVCTAAAYGIGMTDTMRGAVFQHLGAWLSLGLGDRMRATRGLCGLALSTCTGGLKTAKLTAEAIRAARALGDDLRDPYCDALIEGAEGFAAYMLEDWVKADQHLEAAEARFGALRGVTFELATSRMMHGRALIQLGRFNDLQVYVGTPLRDAIRRNDVYSMANTRATVAALLALARDDVAAAEHEVAEATKILGSYRFQMQHVYCFYAGCLADIYRGAPEAALLRLDTHRAALKASLFERVQSVRVLLLHLRARAHLALARRGADAREHIVAADRAARLLRKERLPGAVALSSLVSAASASLHGDTTRAAEGLREAIAGFDGLRMALHAASARHVLGGLVGGDEGRALVRVSLAHFEEQHVAAPARFVRHYAAGFPD